MRGKLFVVENRVKKFQTRSCRLRKKINLTLRFYIWRTSFFSFSFAHVTRECLPMKFTLISIHSQCKCLPKAQRRGYREGESRTTTLSLGISHFPPTWGFHRFSFSIPFSRWCNARRIAIQTFLVHINESMTTIC